MTSIRHTLPAALMAVGLTLSTVPAHALEPIYSFVNPSPWDGTPVAGQGTWETTLQARDANGDGTTDAYYDTVLDVTWLRDAVYTSYYPFDDPSTALNGFAFAGVDGWRLPDVTSATGICSSGYNPYGSATACGFNAPLTAGAQVTSELAHLWTVTLGNTPFYGSNPASQYFVVTECDDSGLCVERIGYNGQAGWQPTSGGGGFNFNAASFWTGSGAYVFNTLGFQGRVSGGLVEQPDGSLQMTDYETPAVIAVHSGDVFATSPVPEPDTAWLMLGGLLALFGKRRRRAG